MNAAVANRRCAIGYALRVCAASELSTAYVRIPAWILEKRRTDVDGSEQIADMARMQNESTAHRVVRLMGGRQNVVAITGWPIGRVDGWLKAGNIHPKWQAELLGRALGAGIALTATDFVWHLVGVQPIPRANITAQAA